MENKEKVAIGILGIAAILTALKLIKPAQAEPDSAVIDIKIIPVD